MLPPALEFSHLLERCPASEEVSSSLKRDNEGTTHNHVPHAHSFIRSCFLLQLRKRLYFDGGDGCVLMLH